MFQSKQLEFRKIDPKMDNLENYLSWLRDPVSNPYISGVNTDLELDSLIDYINTKNSTKNCYLLGIYTRNGLNHIGNIKLEPIEPELGLAWIGMLIGELEFRGKGLGSEALDRATSFFSEVFGIRSFHLGVDPENLPAMRMYTSQGFSFNEEKSLSFGKYIMSRIYTN